MGYFDDLFFEETLEEFKIKDYLDRTPALPFADNNDYMTAGTNMLNYALYEAANFEVESLSEFSIDGFKEKVKNFIGRVVEVLKKAWQIIASTIQKFLQNIQDIFTKDKLDVKKDEVYKKLEEYREKHGVLKFTGTLIDEAYTDKGFGEYEKNMDALHNCVEASYNQAKDINDQIMSTGYANSKAILLSKVDNLKDVGKEYLIKKMFNNDTTDVREAIVQHMTKKWEDRIVDKNLCGYFVDTCIDGFKKITKNVKSIYNESRKHINGYIAYCEYFRYVYFSSKLYSKLYKNKDAENGATTLGATMKNIGKILMIAGGIMSQYSGTYCQIVREDWMNSRRMVLLITKGKGEKEEKKSSDNKEDMKPEPLKLEDKEAIPA